jgi:hypothetical protein
VSASSSPSTDFPPEIHGLEAVQDWSLPSTPDADAQAYWDIPLVQQHPDSFLAQQSREAERSDIYPELPSPVLAPAPLSPDSPLLPEIDVDPNQELVKNWSLPPTPYTDRIFYWDSPLLRGDHGLVPSAEGVGYVPASAAPVASSSSSSFELPQLDQNQLLDASLPDMTSPPSGSVDEDFAPLRESETRGKDWRGRMLPVENGTENRSRSLEAWLSPTESLVSAIQIPSRAGPAKVKVSGRIDALAKVRNSFHCPVAMTD